MKWILDALFSITHPAYWMMNDPYSPGLDSALIQLLDSHKFVKTSKHTATIGGINLWVSNHTYASFTLTNMRGRPSRRTVAHAQERLIQDTILAQSETYAAACALAEAAEKEGR